MYDPDVNKWTLVSPMCAHEGVVGVAVLADNITDSNLISENSSDSLSSSSLRNYLSQNVNTSSSLSGNPLSASTNPLSARSHHQHNNYYSLMEEEEDYSSSNNVLTPSEGDLSQS